MGINHKCGVRGDATLCVVIFDNVFIFDIYQQYCIYSIDAVLYLGDNTFVIEWFAGINCIILWSQI